jgi:hypothetical protein
VSAIWEDYSNRPARRPFWLGDSKAKSKPVSVSWGRSESLAHNATTAKAYEPPQEALREALNVASQLSDPKLEAGLLGAFSMVRRARVDLSDNPVFVEPTK